MPGTGWRGVAVTRPAERWRKPMTTLKAVKVAPKGMGLNDFVAHQEGYFAAEGLAVEFDWKTFRGTQSSWKGLDYFQRPQDRPYTQSKEDVIQGACAWGTVCNASAGMGRIVREGYGISPWAIFVRPDSPSSDRRISPVCRSPSACAPGAFQRALSPREISAARPDQDREHGWIWCATTGTARQGRGGRQTAATADRHGRAVGASQDHGG